jgi:pimeloyl-ACP methyl ester carboxylesterase
VHGENDRLIPPENAHTLARAVPGARLAIVPRASHLFITDQTDQTCETVLSFLAEC